MNNGRGTDQQDRKEPSLSPLSDLDSIPPEQDDRLRARIHSPSARPAAVTAKPAKTGGLWFFMLLVIAGLVAIGGYGYMELQRLKGMQRSMMEQVNQLATASDEIGSQLNASGGQLKETQTTLNSRVQKLESSIAGQTKSADNASQASKKMLADLEAKIEFQLNAQNKAVSQLKDTLTNSVDAKVSSGIAAVQKDKDKQSKAVSALEAEVKKLSERIGSETQNLQQSMSLMKEEVMSAPNTDLKKLQDQFTTYIQSVDQFRQQTNASLNELSGEVRSLQNNSQQRKSSGSSNSGYSDPYEGTGFGVEPVR